LKYLKKKGVKPSTSTILLTEDDDSTDETTSTPPPKKTYKKKKAAKTTEIDEEEPILFTTSPTSDDEDEAPTPKMSNNNSNPNDVDSLIASLQGTELYRFKSRARLRHETFNGRIKHFASLRDTFRHGEEKHRLAFEAICVTVQYQMENGKPLYDV
jgi:hypothetical protein